MIKKTITYTDFNGIERKEDHYFNLSRAEVMTWSMTEYEDLDVKLQKIVDAKDKLVIMQAFQEIIDKSYGVKSEDGKRIMKSEEILRSFKESDAYSEFLMELMSDADYAATFVQGILPKMDTEEKK